MVASIDTEKALEKFTIFHDVALMKLGTVGMHFSILKAILDKPLANITLNVERLKPFPLK
jgi:hypothetical protein